ncbi:TonB-dependent receptor [bacterium]|nr:TonB-dependent receptor [candidate division CSSED10-310 bacterium]
MKLVQVVIFTLILGFLIPVAGYGQTGQVCVLEGKVINRETGSRIGGVLIDASTGDQIRTDTEGHFRMSLPEGEIRLTLTHPDYMELTRILYLAPGRTRQVVLELNTRVVYEDSATVEASYMPEIETVKNVTPDYVIKAPGAFEDTMQSLQVMPGVVGGDDYTARLFIHGGRPDQNGIYLDGIPIYDPYRLFGLTSIFNPETIDYVKLYPGGFDARYGDRLSAVIDVENRTGTVQESFAGSLNASLTNANMVLEGRLSDSVPSSWLVSARRTYYDLLLKQVDDNNSTYPNFTDFQSILYLQPSANHQWKLTALGGVEGTDLISDEESVPDADPDHVSIDDAQRNMVVALNGSHLVTNRSRLSYKLAYLQNRQTSDVYFVEGETSYDTTFDQTLTSSGQLFSGLCEWFPDGHSILAGVDVMRSDNSVEFNIDTNDPRVDIPDDLLTFSEDQNFLKVDMFLQDAWEIVRELEFKAGIRWDSSTLSDINRFSPRISLRWAPDDEWEYRAAWGYYYQFASYETLQGEGYFLDLRGIKDLHLKPELAIHSMVSVEYTSRDRWNLSVDLYYKELTDLLNSGEEMERVLILDDDDVPVYYDRDSMTFVPANSGNGYARGVDVTWRVDDTRTRPWYGMLTYSYCDTRSRQSNKPERPESWDRTHAVTWIGGWKINDRWDIGWRWSYGTGFPYTPVSRVIRVVDDVNANGLYEPELGETFSWQRDDPDTVIHSKRYPDYHRLDARVQYSRDYLSFKAVYYIDIINLYGNKNIQDYYYNEDFSKEYSNEGMPFLPSFGVKIRF